MSKRPKHSNAPGKCPGCQFVIDKYPGFYEPLAAWFFDVVRAAEPEAHVSHAGRGKEEQNSFVEKGTSLAFWGQSPHNYNLALDIFRITPNGVAEWSKNWYKDKILPLVPDWIMAGAKFPRFVDYPHFEVKGWKSLVKSRAAKLVE